MQITAGKHTIPVFSVIEGQGGVQGVMCDTVQLSLMGVPALELMQDIMAGNILTDDGRALAGYDGLAEVRLTLYRQPQDARDRAMQEMTAEAERRAEAERKAAAEAEVAQTELNATRAELESCKAELQTARKQLRVEKEERIMTKQQLQTVQEALEAAKAELPSEVTQKLEIDKAQK